MGVPFGVDLGHVGSCVAEEDLGGFEAVGGAYLRCPKVVKLVRRPNWDVRLLAGIGDRVAVALNVVRVTGLLTRLLLYVRARLIPSVEASRTGRMASSVKLSHGIRW